MKDKKINKTLSRALLIFISMLAIAFIGKYLAETKSDKSLPITEMLEIFGWAALCAVMLSLVLWSIVILAKKNGAIISLFTVGIYVVTFAVAFPIVCRDDKLKLAEINSETLLVSLKITCIVLVIWAASEVLSYVLKNKDIIKALTKKSGKR